VTHQGIEDVGIMRGMPRMNVLVPADAIAARELTRIAARSNGPFYLRLMRDVLPPVYDEGEKFELGRGKKLREGTNVTIVAMGDMVHHALAAAAELSNEGIEAEVIDAVCLKPLDAQMILQSAAKTHCIVTVEDHSIINGLGSAVCEACSGQTPVPVYRLGLRDTFAESGKYLELLEKYKFSARHIVAAARELVRKNEADR
jgi:transketolase